MIEVEMPDGSIAEFPDGMSNAEIESVLSRHNSAQIVGKNPVTGAPITDFSQAFNQTTSSPLQKAGDLSSAFMSGANQLVPALLGLPVDAATNIANLGIAGYGMGKVGLNKLLGNKTDPNALPDTLGPQAGGSEWLKQKIASLIGGDPFTAPNPQDPMQQNAQMVGGIAASGLLAPSTGASNVLGNIARTVPASAGAVAGKELFPDQPLAPIAGMVLGGAATSLTPSRAKVVSGVKRANELGYKLLPKSMKNTKTQDVIQGVGGTVPTKQLASLHNQKITNSLVKKEFGIADDIELSPDTFNEIRKVAGGAYQKAQQFGRIKADKTFVRNMGKLQRPGALAKDFPDAVKKDLINEVKKYNVNEMSSEGLIAASKQLRRDATQGFKSLEPQVKDLARVQKQIADQLDDLLLRSSQKIAPEIYPELKAARQTIAKTYTAEKALKDNGNIDAIALAKEMRKGAPLSGNLKDVAEFGKRFPEVAQWKPPQTTNVRGMDVAVGVLGGTVDPKLISLVMGRPILRKVILSKAYQNLNAKVPDKALRDVLSLPKASQAGALVFLLEQAKNQDDLTQPSSQSQ